MTTPPSSTFSPQKQLPPSPSRVVHLRNLKPDVPQSMLLEQIQQFGRVTNCLILKGKNQALVEFADVPSASSFVNSCAKHPFQIKTSTVYAQFSSHQELHISEETAQSRVKPSRILLVSIADPRYVINVSIISTVFSHYETSPRKNVEKIVIFEKVAGLQALVQFSNIESATKAKEMLDGKCIYGGCCTMTIQYSNLSDLNIKENSDKTMDFTRPNLPQKDSESLLGPGGRSPYPDPRMVGMQGRMPLGMGMSSMGMGGMGGMGLAGMAPMGAMSPMGGLGGLPSDRMMRGSAGVLPGSPQSSESPVLFVSGFPPERMTCMHLFNLFSNYGIILRIRIVAKKPNSALIQFDTPISVTHAIIHLQNARVYGNILKLSPSKFPALTPSPFAGPQGSTPSATSPLGEPVGDDKAMDFDNTRLNRYNRFGPTNVAKLSHPSDTLHVSNLTATVTGDQLKAHFATRCNATQPTSPLMPTQVKLFEKDGKNMALLQFSNADSAIEALMLCHNSLIEGRPIRVSFTKNRI